MFPDCVPIGPIETKIEGLPLGGFFDLGSPICKVLARVPKLPEKVCG